MRKEFNQLYEYLNKAFNSIEEQFSLVDERFMGVNKRFDKVESNISEVKSDMAYIKSQMATKSYLDDKLADLNGDLISKLRKEDAKVDRLVDILEDKSVLDKNDLSGLASFKIFPKVPK